MKKPAKELRVDNSGQLLLVAALAIAILISSTTIYVYELSRGRQNIEDTLLGDFILAVKQGAKNAIISALANITRGGEKAVLAENLNMLSEAYLNLSQPGICRLSYTLPEGREYEGGVKVSWNTDGLGVSSACADFTLSMYGLTSSITLTYKVNVTTAIMLSGYYFASEAGKNVNVTCRVFNEGSPAKAGNIALYYRDDEGVWIPVNPLNSTMIDCGDGTYIISFTAAVSSAALEVSACVQDLRGVHVRANATCHQT